MHPKTKQKFDIGSENPAPIESGEVLSRHSATVRAIGSDTKKKKANWNLGQGTRAAAGTGEPTKEDLDDILEQGNKRDYETFVDWEQEDFFFGATHASTTVSEARSSTDNQTDITSDNCQKTKNREKSSSAR